ncbi:Dabb family protein [Maribacter sp. CXY002]|uniref:Dabb family protein n=1 Tax=Maribacter luteocoastalis TaxID=3407671 RepID=UPI003B66B44F
MIKHSVLFNFREDITPTEQHDFFKSTNNLSLIVGVKDLEILRQFNAKNTFQYSISMAFDTLEAYHRYNDHAEHQSFIQKQWLPLVKDFLEIDLKAI